MMKTMGRQAKMASRSLARLDAKQKNLLLRDLGENLIKRKDIF